MTILCSWVGWIRIRSIRLLRISRMLKFQVILLGANRENGLKEREEDLKLGGLVMFPVRWEIFFFFENPSSPRYSERADMWWGFEKLRRCCVWNIPKSMFGSWHFRRMISYCFCFHLLYWNEIQLLTIMCWFFVF